MSKKAARRKRVTRLWLYRKNVTAKGWACDVCGSSKRKGSGFYSLFTCSLECSKAASFGNSLALKVVKARIDKVAKWVKAGIDKAIQEGENE